MTEQTQDTIGRAVDETRKRLNRGAGRELLRRHGIWALAAAAAVGAARPLYWPMAPEAPLWAGAAAALAVMLTAMTVGFVALALVGRRRGPSPLAASRAIDAALGLKEVVASGFAFARDGREGPLEAMVRRQAGEAVAEFSARGAFALPSLRPRRRSLGLGLGAVLLVALVGSYHPALASILASPPTEREMSAAARLDELARQLERGRAPGERDRDRERDLDRERNREGSGLNRDEAHRELARKARSAARAARRGDRAGAMRDLDDLRRSGRSASRESEALRAALREIAKSLAVRPARGRESRSGEDGEDGGARPGSKSGESRGERGKGAQHKAAEAMRELAESLREGRQGGEGRSKTAAAEQRAQLEALARAAAHSKSLAAGDGEQRELAARLAEALTKAGEALGAGDREEAARRLEEAAARAAELERAREASQREAEAIARMLEAAGVLSQAMQMAMAGESGQRGERAMSMGLAMMGEGEGEGEGQGQGQGQGKMGSSTALARALALRMAALGLGGDPSGRPGTGPEGHADNWGKSRPGLPVKGSLRARAQVSEGELAVTAIKGMGRNAEPTKEYRDVYPSYAALAEEAMGDEVVPAAQRRVVRRYFESIRPGGAAPASERAESEQEPTDTGEEAGAED